MTPTLKQIKSWQKMQQESQKKYQKKQQQKNLLKKSKPIKKISEKRKKLLNEYKKVRELVYIRDNGRCRSVGCNNLGTQVHHIIKRSHSKALHNDINNLVLLCNDCHRLIEEYKKPNVFKKD